MVYKPLLIRRVFCPWSGIHKHRTAVYVTHDVVELQLQLKKKKPNSADTAKRSEYIKPRLNFPVSFALKPLKSDSVSSFIPGLFCIFYIFLYFFIYFCIFYIFALSLVRPSFSYTLWIHRVLQVFYVADSPSVVLASLILTHTHVCAYIY